MAAGAARCRQKGDMGVMEQLQPEQPDAGRKEGVMEPLRPEQPDAGRKEGVMEPLRPEQPDAGRREGVMEPLRLEQPDAGRREGVMEQLLQQGQTDIGRREQFGQEEQLRMENEHYRQILRQLVQEEEKLHAANQERIKNGIHCLFFIPMLFFALLFLTKGEKAVFLVLWIVSLFVTAAYMIYIEYLDFQVKERLARYAGSEDLMQDGLIGADLEEFEEAVSQLLGQIDERKALRRRRMREILQQGGKSADTGRKDTHYE